MNFFFHISEGISVVIVVVVVVVGSPDFVNRNCEEFGGGGRIPLFEINLGLFLDGNVFGD